MVVMMDYIALHPSKYDIMQCNLVRSAITMLDRSRQDAPVPSA